MEIEGDGGGGRLERRLRSGDLESALADRDLLHDRSSLAADKRRILRGRTKEVVAAPAIGDNAGPAQ